MSEIDIPPEWAITSIQCVADVKGGKRLPKGEKFSGVNTSFAYIRVTDFASGGIDTSDLKYIDSKVRDRIINYTISSEDLYISIAGTIGLVGEVPHSLDGANLTENAAKICNLAGVSKNFLKYVLNSKNSVDQFQDKMTSSGQPKLALFRIKDCTFPLPPLAEQKAIAQKLDTLLTQVETTKARLDRIPDILKRFRQSVLAVAVSGKLTEEWRGGKKFGDKKRLGDIIDKGPQNGLYKQSIFYGRGTKILRIDSFYDGSVVSWSELKRVEIDNVDLKKWKLEINDVLVNRVNSVEYLGKCALIRELPEAAVFESNIMRMSIDSNVALPEFVTLFLRSPEGLGELRSNAKLAVNQASINQNDVKNCTFLLPSIGEQTEIVKQVEIHLAHADSIEKYVRAAQEQVNSLTQSILAKAFSGELTADWRAANPELISGENSAESLLLKIKAEREAVKPKRKTKKKA